MADNNDTPLSDETRVYLEGARQRVDRLAPVGQLRDEVAQVELPFDDKRDAALEERREWLERVGAEKRVPVPPAIETISEKDQKKVRRLRRRYGGAVPVDMVRHPDHGTSVEAAATVVPGLSELQEIIYACFVTHGAMTDEQLEELPEIVRLDLGKTTARRRRTDLCRMGKLVIVGAAKNARGNEMNLYDIPSRSSTSHVTRRAAPS